MSKFRSKPYLDAISDDKLPGILHDLVIVGRLGYAYKDPEGKWRSIKPNHPAARRLRRLERSRIIMEQFRIAGDLTMLTLCDGSV